MDIFYEESAGVQNKASEVKKYRIWHTVSLVFLWLGILGLIFGFAFVPINGLIVWGIFCLTFFLAWYFARRIQKKYNVTYDYVFVSGELRISRVFHTSRRKLLTRIQAENVLQIGDIDNSAFNGLYADPTTKKIVCTSNTEAAEGKFFMYLLVAENGKTLYVLECRETLLMHILRFAGRAALESDYVAQEKKVR